MNKVYKVIWNAATGTWVAVSELGKAKTKTKSVTLAVATALAVAAGSAHAELNEIQGSSVFVVTDANQKSDIVKPVLQENEGVFIGTQLSSGSASAAGGNTSVMIGLNLSNEESNSVVIGKNLHSGKAGINNPETGGVSDAGNVVIGKDSSAQAGDAVVIGNNATSTLGGGVAIGKNAHAESTNDIAIGTGAHAVSQGGDGGTTNSGNQASIAIGVGAKADAWKTVSIGTGSEATREGGTALGNEAMATDVASTALGEKTQATGQGSTAAGRGAIANSQAATAVGNAAQATAVDASAYGDGAVASGLAATASGRLAEATGVASTATGQAAKATEQNTVATGSASQATAYAATATGFNSQATALDATAIGQGTLASAATSSALGSNAKATGQNSSALGAGAQSSGTNSLASGAFSKATGFAATALGTNANAAGNYAIASGEGSQATANNAIAMGRATIVADGATNSVAIGRGNLILAPNAFVLGTNVENPHENSVVLGANSAAAGYAAAPNTVVGAVDGSPGYTYDANKYAGHVDDTHPGNYVSIGAVGDERQLKNLAAGTISAGSTDGVNGSQLYAVMDRLESVSRTGFNVGQQNTAGNVNNGGDTTNATNVGLQSNLDFNNGALTVATVTVVPNGSTNDAKVVYDVVTQELAATSADGKAAVGTNPAQAGGVAQDAANPNALTTAQNVADAINASGWKVQGQGADKDIVNPGDTVNFVNGSATTAVVESKDGVTTVKYDLNVDEVTTKIANGSFAVKTVPLTTEGTAAAGDQKTTVAEADKNAIATAGDVVTAVNSARESVSTGNADTVKVETSANGVGGTDYKVTVVTSPITQSGNAADGTQKSETAAPNAIATAGDVVNAVNSARETVVSKDKTVTVTKAENAFGGTEYDLSIKTNSNTVKFTDAGVLEVATATIAPADAATGVVAAPSTTNGTIATAADVVNAINSAGWVVANTDGTTAVVNAGDKVVHANGAGTTANVTTAGNTTTVIYNVNTDNGVTTKVDPATNAVVVATGTITPADPNTGKLAVADTTNGTIATVGDVVNAVNSAGFALKGNGEQKDIVTAGDSLNFVNGIGTIAEVKPNGDVTFNLDVDSTTIQVDPATGKIEAVTSPITKSGNAAAGNQKSATANPNAIATAGDVVDAVNSARETVTSANRTIIVTPSANDLGGTNYDLAVRVDGNTVQINNKGELVANAVINLRDGINTKVTQVETTDGTRVYQIDANKDLVDINSIQLNGPKGADGTHGKDGATLTTAQGPAGVDGKDGETKTRIVYQPLDANGQPAGEPEQVATLNDGLKFVGDDGQVVVKKLNETLTVKGNAGSKALTEGNIGVVNENGNMIVKLAKDVDLGANSSLTANTVNVKGTDGSNVAMTTNRGPSFNTAGQADGGTVNVLNVGTAANPTRLAGVANGQISADSRDAINGSQLHNAVTNINNRIGDLDQNRKAGAASAMAAAGLPQAYREGQSGVVAALGQYQGETGVAVGFTSISDNGKWLFRGAYATNTQNEHSGNLGLGYFW